MAEHWAAIIMAEKECCFVQVDCQESPYADPHVRWCGRREGKPSRRPDWPISLLLCFPALVQGLESPERFLSNGIQFMRLLSDLSSVFPDLKKRVQA